MGNQGSKVENISVDDSSITQYKVDGYDEYFGESEDLSTNFDGETSTNLSFDASTHSSEYIGPTNLDLIQNIATDDEDDTKKVVKVTKTIKVDLPNERVKRKKPLQKIIGFWIFLVCGLAAVFFGGFFCGRLTGPGESSTASLTSNESRDSPEAYPTQLSPISIPTPIPIRTPSSAEPPKEPIVSLTLRPTGKPTGKPTVKPTVKPTQKPTGSPVTIRPTGSPTKDPTKNPTTSPTIDNKAPDVLFATAGIVIYNRLKEYMGDDAEALDPKTPQGKAFQDIVAAESVMPVSDYRLLQRYVLRTLYYSTVPESWTNSDGWDVFESTHECTFHGVSVCRRGPQGAEVVKLDLSDNNLVGTIPKEICLLSETLERIDLSLNSLYGYIPPCVSDFKTLKTLDLHGNSLTGSLPEALMFSPDLKIVDLSDNKLEGTLDVIFEGWEDDREPAINLKTFKVNSNKLTGVIPPVFDMLPQLLEVSFEDNDFDI